MAKGTSYEALHYADHLRTISLYEFMVFTFSLLFRKEKLESLLIVTTLSRNIGIT